MVVSQQPGTRSSYSASSSQYVLSSCTTGPTSISFDLSPCKTPMDDDEQLQTSSLLTSSEMQEAFNLEGHRNDQRHDSCIKQSLRKDDLRQTVTTETKSSPLSAKTTSLRLPSQKIGFFDMKLETSRHDQDGVKHYDEGKSTRNQPSFKKQTLTPELKEKKNNIHSEDTVFELELKKGSPSPSQLAANGSSTSTGQCSSSSKKRLTKTLFSPTPCTSTTSVTKASPLKKLLSCKLRKPKNHV